MVFTLLSLPNASAHLHRGKDMHQISGYKIVVLVLLEMHKIQICWLPQIIWAGAHDQTVAANSAPAVLWEEISVHMMSASTATSVISAFVLCCVCFLCAQEIRLSRPPASRGKNVFLQVYISADICLMSARVERCIEHVRRPLAARWGWQIASHGVTAHSVSLLASFISSIPLPIINEI